MEVVTQPSVSTGALRSGAVRDDSWRPTCHCCLACSSASAIGRRAGSIVTSICTERFPISGAVRLSRSSACSSRPGSAVTAGRRFRWRRRCARSRRAVGRRLWLRTAQRASRPVRRSGAAAEVPHLILDGVAMAARAVGAREAVIAISEHDDRGARAVADALGERRKARVRCDPRFDTFSDPERHLGSVQCTCKRDLRSAAQAHLRASPVRTRCPQPAHTHAERRDARAPGADRPPRPRLVPAARDAARSWVDARDAVRRHQQVHRFAVGLVSATVRPVSVGMRSRVSCE